MKEKIILLAQRAIDGKKTPLCSLLRSFFYFVSLFFALFVFLKNLFYDLKFFKPKKVTPYVISIGNIVAGGSGKTPMTIYLANFFFEKKKKVAIVIRGYGGKIVKQNKNVVVCKNEGKIYGADFIGDESAFLANRLPFAYIIVGKDKCLSAKVAEGLGVDVILLDDGFQHRRLHRDLDMVLIDAKKPISNGHFLPRGYLRDFPSRLRKAHLTVLTNAKNLKLNDLVLKYSKGPFLFTKPIFSFLKDLNGKPLDFFNEKIGVFCAIANPHFFIDLLKDLKYEIVFSHFGVDHSFFGSSCIEKMAEEAFLKGAKALICTEKDFIKLKGDIKTKIPIYYVEIDIQIISGKENLIKLISKKGIIL
jgi:tetraacyldisaccharide 4'-kinase